VICVEEGQELVTGSSILARVGGAEPANIVNGYTREQEFGS